ncbi:HalX domain-containing protein [Haladaptatus litoreus]|uniref:HalX domain-containing protein n=1 Tax=Haladaptatus litoreus TaxID=553468 RepID=A0A1N6VFF4_9EURY|nr:response regulator [Haladaptatus litoreus]SIQ76459.1 HalX domain-containing protein [Haladaptatus litoreus]
MIGEEEIGVLIVDDETEVTDLYEAWLSAYRTHTVHDGEEAIAFLDQNADRIDVVLLDRKMPGLNGEAVLKAIRDRGHDCPVAMITAVAPDYDIIDMAFDEYVTKPVDGDQLRTTVDELRSRAQYADDLSRYFSLVSTHASLVSEHPADELRENEEFVALEAELETVRDTIDNAVDFGDHREFQHLLRELD